MASRDIKAPLWFMRSGPDNIQIEDEAGHVANTDTYDVWQSTGIIEGSMRG